MVIYRKIPIISPGAYFWSKGLFVNFFLGGGGVIFGRAYTWTNICVLKTLYFVQEIVIFQWRFSTHKSLLLIFFFFTFLEVL